MRVDSPKKLSKEFDLLGSRRQPRFEYRLERGTTMLSFQRDPTHFRWEHQSIHPSTWLMRYSPNDLRTTVDNASVTLDFPGALKKAEINREQWDCRLGRLEDTLTTEPLAYTHLDPNQAVLLLLVAKWTMHFKKVILDFWSSLLINVKLLITICTFQSLSVFRFWRNQS